jgi:hypothetical protein
MFTENCPIEVATEGSLLNRATILRPAVPVVPTDTLTPKATGGGGITSSFWPDIG